MSNRTQMIRKMDGGKLNGKVNDFHWRSKLITRLARLFNADRFADHPSHRRILKRETSSDDA